MKIPAHVRGKIPCPVNLALLEFEIRRSVAQDVLKSSTWRVLLRNLSMIRHVMGAHRLYGFPKLSISDPKWWIVTRPWFFPSLCRVQDFS